MKRILNLLQSVFSQENFNKIQKIEISKKDWSTDIVLYIDRRNFVGKIISNLGTFEEAMAAIENLQVEFEMKVKKCL